MSEASSTIPGGVVDTARRKHGAFCEVIAARLIHEEEGCRVGERSAIHHPRAP
jgi:hypothetical protein